MEKKRDPIYRTEMQNLVDNPADWEDIDNDPQLLTRRLGLIKVAAEKHKIKLDENTSMLEVGSGDGMMLEHLQDNGIPVVGVDLRPRGEDQQLSVAAKIEALPFMDNHFDIVNSMQAFDADAYDQDQEQMLHEIARVLKPGGLFLAQLEEIDPEALTKITNLKEEPAEIESMQRVFVKT